VRRQDACLPSFILGALLTPQHIRPPSSLLLPSLAAPQEQLLSGGRGGQRPELLCPGPACRRAARSSRVPDRPHGIPGARGAYGRVRGAAAGARNHPGLSHSPAAAGRGGSGGVGMAQRCGVCGLHKVRTNAHASAAGAAADRAGGHVHLPEQQGRGLEAQHPVFPLSFFGTLCFL